MILSPEELTNERLSSELKSICDILQIGSLQEALIFPRYVQIETVRHCNARCPFCAVDVWDKTHPWMTDEVFDRIVEQLIPHVDWIRWVNMQKAGEVTLDPHAAERIRKLKAVGIRHVLIATNGALFDRDRAIQYFSAGLDEVMFSIDRVDPVGYSETKAGLDYETVVANIRGSIALRNKGWPHVRIRIRGLYFGDFDSPEAERALKAYQAFWASEIRPGDRVHFQRPHHWGGQYDWGGRLHAFGDVYHPCIMPWSTLSITAMGHIALCPQDFNASMQLGDVRMESLEKIWRSVALQRLRAFHASGQRNEIKLCRGCVLYDRDAAPENVLSSQEPTPITASVVQD